MKSLLSAYKKRISPQKIYIYIDLNICKCIIIGGLTVSSIAMNIAGFPFFFFGYIFFFAWLIFFFSFVYASYSACSLWPAALWLSHCLLTWWEKSSSLFSVTAGTSHHQCLTLLWPWSSVSSHTLNAGCLAPIGGSQMACFACSVLVRCLSSEAPLLYLMWLEASYLVKCLWRFGLCNNTAILVVQCCCPPFYGSNLTDF